MSEEQAITVEQLRRLLFHIHDENMTVKELRKRLYHVEDQETELYDQFDVWMKIGVEWGG